MKEQANKTIMNALDNEEYKLCLEYPIIDLGQLELPILTILKESDPKITIKEALKEIIRKSSFTILYGDTDTLLTKGFYPVNIEIDEYSEFFLNIDFHKKTITIAPK